MATSATGVTSVVTGWLVLLIRFVSSVGELTLAVLLSVPLSGAITSTVRFVVALTAKVPSDQLTIPALVVPPPDAPANVTPAGSASVTTTPTASDGPKFGTEI